MSQQICVTHDKNGKLAWQSAEQCLFFVERFGRRSSTSEQKQAVAQYMLDHQTAVFAAEAAVLNVADLSNVKGLMMTGRILN